jgi:two-component system, sporulation sensor kinase E
MFDWDVYSNRTKFKVAIGLAVILVSSVSQWYTNKLVTVLADREKRLIDLSAKAYKEIATAENFDNLSIWFREIIEANNSVPVILADENDGYISHRNFEIPKKLKGAERDAFIKKQISEMKAEYDPIIIEIPGLKQYIYYRNSDIIKALKYYPFLQLGVIGLLAVIGYGMFSISRNAEQNRVWVGLAKETAHQLGTPLSSLIAWVEYFKGDPELAHQPFVEEIQKDISRLEMVTSRFSSIGSIPSLSQENMVAVVSETMKYLEKRISSKVKFSLETEPKDELIYAYINKPLFDWVVENLCKNAVDAIGKNPGKVSVTISQGDDSKIRIDVTDSGKGIPRSEFKKVFEPGFTTKKRGWGLGLTLVKRIVENYHRGRIFVKWSEVGQGTTFRVILHQKPVKPEAFS